MTLRTTNEIYMGQSHKVGHSKKSVICDAYGCNNYPTEKIDIPVGKFGTISLLLCQNCLEKFQDQKSEANDQTTL